MCYSLSGDSYERNIDTFVNTIEDSVLGFVGNLPEFISGTLTESVGAFFTQIRQALAGDETTLTQDIAGSLGGAFSLSWITTPLSGVITTAKYRGISLRID